MAGDWCWLRRLMLGLLAIACLAMLYGCPLSEILDDLDDVSDSSEVTTLVSMIVTYRVTATMQDNNGTYTTVHETQVQDLFDLDEQRESGYGAYNPLTRTYIGSFMFVTFNEDFTEVTDLRFATFEEMYWPVLNQREDKVIAARIPKLDKVSNYYLGDEYMVFRSANPCSVISTLEYERTQYSDPPFYTTLKSFACDTDSYIDFAINDPKFGQR